MKRLPRMLAIDPGTNCGYSWIDIAQPMPPGLNPLPHQSGIWDLSKNKFDSQGMRFIQLKRCLVEVAPDFVVFEEVKFRHKSTHAAAMYWGVVAVIQSFCEENGIEYTGVDTSRLKRRATGKGNAGKEAMIDAANDEFAINPPLTNDNIADAMWLLKYGLEAFGQVVTYRKPGRKVDELKQEVPE